METEIIESYQTFEGEFDFRTDLMFDKVLPLSNKNYALLKKNTQKGRHRDMRRC